jgi:hypothetical protein
MAHGMNDDLGFCGFVKNDVGIGRCRQTADDGIIRPGADVGMKQEKVDNSLNPGDSYSRVRSRAVRRPLLRSLAGAMPQ